MAENGLTCRHCGRPVAVPTFNCPWPECGKPILMLDWFRRYEQDPEIVLYEG